MKKVIALLLAAVMSVSLAACGTENQTLNNNENTNGQTSTTENVSTTNGTQSQPTNNTEAQLTSEPEDSTVPAFDAGWAGDEYVMPIPEPPFTKFTVQHYDRKDHTQYYVYSADESEISALTEEDIVTYCDLLKNNGFTNVTVELEYNKDNCMFRAFTEDEMIEVCVDCYIESGNIVIYVKQNITE